MRRVTCSRPAIVSQVTPNQLHALSVSSSGQGVSQSSPLVVSDNPNNAESSSSSSTAQTTPHSSTRPHTLIGACPRTGHSLTYNASFPLFTRRLAALFLWRRPDWMIFRQPIRSRSDWLLCILRCPQYHCFSTCLLASSPSGCVGFASCLDELESMHQGCDFLAFWTFVWSRDPHLNDPNIRPFPSKLCHPTTRSRVEDGIYLLLNQVLMMHKMFMTG